MLCCFAQTPGSHPLGRDPGGTIIACDGRVAIFLSTVEYSNVRFDVRTMLNRIKEVMRFRVLVRIPLQAIQTMFHVFKTAPDCC